MMPLCRIFVVLPVILFSLAAQAQPAKIHFDHYGPADGLVSRVTRSVLKTSDGLVWITSEDGLVRYDSERFYFFRHNPLDSTSIAFNACDQMVIDRQEHIWVVAGPYLDRFDPSTGQFTHCFIQQDTGRFYHLAPESLLYDASRDKIWVGTTLGLYFVEPGHAQLTKAVFEPSSTSRSHEIFLTMTQDASSALWMGSSHGFYQYVPETGTITAYRIPHYQEEVDNNGVTSLYFDQEGTLWIGTWVKGLIRYDTRNRTGQHYYYNPDTLQHQNGIIAITQSGLSQQKDILWLSALHYGFAAFNMRTGTFTHYATAYDGDHSGIIGLTNGLFPTGSEGMWIASENGLHRYDYAAQLFDQTDLSRFKSNLKSAALLEYLTFIHSSSGTDSVGWFHVPYLGAFQYHFTTDEMSMPPSDLLPYLQGAVFGMFVDHDNILWVSTREYGLVGYDTKKGVVLTLDLNPFTQPWSWVTDFYEDRHGRLWLGTFEGLYTLDKGRRAAVAVEEINHYMNSNPVASHITGIAEDTMGRIWVIASGDGFHQPLIAVVDNRGIVKIYCGGTLDKSIAGFEAKLNDLACSGSRVFVGTDDGLAWFEAAEGPGKVQWITTKEGLLNNRIGGLESDGSGGLWCSSVFGITRYQPQSSTILNYTHFNSGLGSAMMPGITVSPNTGRLYVCQQGGFNWEREVPSYSQDDVPSIIITDVRVGERSYYASGKRINQASHILLPANQNQLRIEFALPSFSNEEANRYAYRLKGHDEDWTQTLDGYVNFVGLAPDLYVFQVKGANASGQWSQQVAELQFTIQPPMYQTWWFRLLLFIAISAIVLYVIHLRFKALRQQFDLRTKIAGDLHDEIGSTLTSIHILSNVSQQALQAAPDQAKEMLRQISLQSKAIQQNMSDIVWAIRPDNDKVENVVVRLREYAAQTLEPLNMQTKLLIDEQLVTQVLPLNARKELLLIAKEAINNIVKHSGATEARITMQKKGPLFHFVIWDNGSWKGDLQSSGTGRKSMQQRAGGLGGRISYDIRPEGTQLTLEFPIP